MKTKLLTILLFFAHSTFAQNFKLSVFKDIQKTKVERKGNRLFFTTPVRVDTIFRESRPEQIYFLLEEHSTSLPDSSVLNDAYKQAFLNSGILQEFKLENFSPSPGYLWFAGDEVRTSQYVVYFSAINSFSVQIESFADNAINWPLVYLLLITIFLARYAYQNFSSYSEGLPGKLKRAVLIWSLFDSASIIFGLFGYFSLYPLGWWLLVLSIIFRVVAIWLLQRESKFIIALVVSVIGILLEMQAVTGSVLVLLGTAGILIAPFVFGILWLLGGFALSARVERRSA